MAVDGTPSVSFARLELVAILGALVRHVAHAVVVAVETGRAALAAFASNQAWEVLVQNRLETWQAGADDAGVDLNQSAVRLDVSTNIDYVMGCWVLGRAGFCITYAQPATPTLNRVKSMLEREGTMVTKRTMLMRLAL